MIHAGNVQLNSPSWEIIQRENELRDGVKSLLVFFFHHPASLGILKIRGATGGECDHVARLNVNNLSMVCELNIDIVAVDEFVHDRKVIDGTRLVGFEAATSRCENPCGSSQAIGLSVS